MTDLTKLTFVNDAPLPIYNIALAVPFISKSYCGTDDLIPILPPLIILNAETHPS